MSLVLTRRPGEAIVFHRRMPDGSVAVGRIYVVSIDGNVVRLAIDVRPEVKVLREELLDGDGKGTGWSLGALVAGVASALHSFRELLG